MSVSPLVRRALVTAVALAAATTLAPAAAHAVPETPAPAAEQAGTAATEIELAARMAKRTQALAELNRRADARDRAIAGEQAVLARYGYRGDVDAVSVVLPLASYDVSAAFGLTGPHWESTHGGQDFSAASGETLVAVSDAVVTEVGYAGPYGLRTVLTLDDGTEVWYCHQTTASVTAGQTVEVAQPIGTVGSTGNSTGPHLHLEVRPGGGEPVDPMAFFEAAGLNP